MMMIFLACLFDTVMYHYGLKHTIICFTQNTYNSQNGRTTSTLCTFHNTLETLQLYDDFIFALSV